MKKKLKIFLIVMTVIVLGAGSYLLYLFKFKQYDVADEKVEVIVEDPYTVELPDGKTITLDGDKIVDGEKVVVGSEGVEDSVGDESQENDQNTGVAGTTSTPVNPSSPDDESAEGVSPETGSTNSSTTKKPTNPQGSATSKKPTVAKIKGEYIPAFESLEVQADAKLNALIGVAKKEFTDKRANGDTIDVGYFFNKYSGAASNLEASTDAVFNGVLNAVRKDLESAGYSPTYADSFTKDYEATKKARKDSLMNKALGR